MQANNEIVTEWAKYKERGDATYIAKKLKMQVSNVSVMLSSGKGTVDQIAFIMKFYNKRKKIVDSINNNKAA